MHIVEHASFAVVEDVQAPPLREFDVVGGMDPDVIEGLLFDGIVVRRRVCHCRFNNHSAPLFAMCPEGATMVSRPGGVDYPS
jgi:hypothetical protein